MYRIVFTDEFGRQDSREYATLAAAMVHAYSRAVLLGTAVEVQDHNGTFMCRVSL